jgi:hypothetical protein
MRIIRSHKSTGRQYNHQKENKDKRGRVRIRVFNATFNNSLAISWWSALLMEEIEIPGRIHRPATGH